MNSDYIKLTTADHKTLRVAYDSIEAFFPQSNWVAVASGEAAAMVDGTTILLSNAARFWVRESPEYIDATVEAMYSEQRIDYDADDDDDE
jgi:hypothetical protein